MHKNAYHSKTLIGNWNEERSTQQFEQDNEVSNSFLPNPSYNKYVPISKDYGDKKAYNKVSVFIHFYSNGHHTFRNLLTMLPRTG